MKAYDTGNMHTIVPCPYCDRMFEGVYTNIGKLFAMHCKKSHGKDAKLLKPDDQVYNSPNYNERYNRAIQDVKHNLSKQVMLS